MPETFLHGIEIVEIDAGPRPIQTVRSSVIGLIGTVDSDVSAAEFPYNTPVLIAGSRLEATNLLTDDEGDVAKNGTLPQAFDAIFDQAGALIVAIRVEDVDAGGASGSGSIETTETKIIGGVDGATGQYSGVHAFLAAESALGVVPRILIAPGFTHEQAVVQEMIGVAERLRAVIIADGPNSTDAAAQTYRDLFGSPRVFLVDPNVKAIDVDDGDIVDEPASSRVAGLIAKSDNARGFWHSPSNQTINGILGTARPVDFALGDTVSRANLLNERQVATVVQQNGYRLWGNRTCSSDPKWAFLQSRRIADMIQESLQRAHLWAVDRNISRTYIEDVTEGVNAYLRRLQAQGAIMGGECWADEELNTPATVQDGKIFFNFDFTPTYPAEHITFRSHLVNDYIQEALAA